MIYDSFSNEWKFNNFFLGWEGVGLVSYLLISFWNTRIQANKSSIKAVLIKKK